ncbi:DUF3352 domain-containing protein [Microcoleus sp. FACHB-SPT15]|uniref:DUF3352 domain-containing protein n=1 Tax=Microcoleus sp. FACHB-SPT15 TaxID=2692830 RepID=UPI0017811845|nr:DUF3352 domain-containing protein [Microcoleus sp. FACHB-SPT15]MBD1805727.1 DUF3352 domain-containing protein [Microcoleus sp. FACHB-SPT15]
MKLRSFFYALAAGTVALLFVAAVGFFWLTSQSPLNILRGGTVTTPTAAIFVPKQAPLMASLLVNPDRLEAFRQLVARPENRRRSRAELNQIEESLLANTDINYRRDIQPWIGDEITFAVTSLDFDRNQENAAQPGYLVAVTTKDAQKAREFLQLFYSKQAIAGTEDLVFEQYKGVNLTYKRPIAPIGGSNQTPTPPVWTSAVVGDRFVLFANHPKVLRNALNNVQAANLNLEDDPEYQQVLQSLNEPRIGFSFVNLPALAAWISNQPIPTQESFQASDTVAIALSLNRQGLLAQTALLGSQPSEESQSPTLSKPVEALQYIPAESSLAIAGTDLNQFWNRLSTARGDDDTLKSLLDQPIASLQSRWGIQLPEDIFSWVQGEYALSLLPRPDRDNPDWIFVAQKVPGTTAEESIEHLDAVAKQQGLSTGSLPLGDKIITAWTKLLTTSAITEKDDNLLKLEAQVRGVHTAVGNYEVFTSSIEAMDEALQGLENSLVKSDKFKNAIAPLPEQNDGYLYLDWAQGETLIKRQLPIVQVVELVAKPLFEHLRSLSISSYGIDNGVQHSKLFFQLHNANES